MMQCGWPQSVSNESMLMRIAVWNFLEEAGYYLEREQRDSEFAGHCCDFFFAFSVDCINTSSQHKCISVALKCLDTVSLGERWPGATLKGAVLSNECISDEH